MKWGSHSLTIEAHVSRMETVLTLEPGLTRTSSQADPGAGPLLASLACRLLIDVDHFKKINDEFGHPIGDTVLMRLCRRRETLLPPRALLGRMGGEAFAVWLPTGEPQALHAPTDRLIQGVAEPPWWRG